MSRYGPGVLPQGFDLSELADAFAQGREIKRRRKREDADEERDQERHDLDYYERGGRRGQPPAEDRTIAIPGEPDFPEALDDDEAPAPRSALEPDSFNTAFLDELRTGGPTGSGGAGPTSILQQEPDIRPTTPAGRHPGAFDPATRTFGGSPLQMAVTAGAAAGRRGEEQFDLGPSGRYTTIDDNHYIDEFATPSHERTQDREAQLAMAAAFRQGDIQLRGQQALELEDRRQQGRRELRDRMTAAAMAAIGARGAEQRRTNEEDPRPGRRSSSSTRGSAQTANSRENNAIRMADGIISAAGGSYDAAVDWLENTPEGQSAGQNGLEKRHLYAALGKYLTGATNAALRMQTGAAALEPEEAVQAEAQTRSAIAGRSQSKGTITQAEYNALRARGFTDEQIRARYQIAPDTASPRQQGEARRP